MVVAYLIDFIWCLGRESNSYDTMYRGILSPLRLPIPPPRHRANIYISG